MMKWLMLAPAMVLASLALATPAHAQDAATPSHATKRIALSFDDVPRTRGAFLTTDHRSVMLIAALHRAGVEQAVFFLNPCNIGSGDGVGGEDRIEAYVAAGHVIADHSCTHPHLNASTPEAYLADIDKAEAWLKGREGRRAWFRFPFLDEGGADKLKRDAVRAGLTARGLGNGYVTADGSDWNMEQNTIDAVAAGKKIDMKALGDLYVETMVQAADSADATAVKTLGRSPVHVILLHETDLAALYIDDYVAALRADGWEIVTADAAYADPIAPNALTVDVPSAQGTLIEALAWAKGIPAPRWYERASPEVANPIFAERVLHEKAP